MHVFVQESDEDWNCGTLSLKKQKLLTLDNDIKPAELIEHTSESVHQSV